MKTDHEKKKDHMNQSESKSGKVAGRGRGGGLHDENVLHNSQKRHCACMCVCVVVCAAAINTDFLYM